MRGLKNKKKDEIISINRNTFELGLKAITLRPENYIEAHILSKEGELCRVEAVERILKNSEVKYGKRKKA